MDRTKQDLESNRMMKRIQIIKQKDLSILWKKSNVKWSSSTDSWCWCDLHFEKSVMLEMILTPWLNSKWLKRFDWKL